MHTAYDIITSGNGSRTSEGRGFFSYLSLSTFFPRPPYCAYWIVEHDARGVRYDILVENKNPTIVRSPFTLGVGIV